MRARRLARMLAQHMPQTASRLNTSSLPPPATEGVVYVNSLASLLGHPRSPAHKDHSLQMHFAAANIPHPEKVHRGGEDSYFACPSTKSFGIADGVGGWADAGVDPGEFSRLLMHCAYEDITQVPVNKLADLREVLRTAVGRVGTSQLQGSCTALLGHLHGSTLGLLNLGDSGVIVLRPALRTLPGSERPMLVPRLVFRSCEQTHYFNCPYQVTSGTAEVEEPDLFQVRIEPGDLIIACSDGVLDNLFDKQIQAIAGTELADVWLGGGECGPGLNALAQTLAVQAQNVGKAEPKNDVPTPWSVGARAEGIDMFGGKLDDTTVVVALTEVAEASSSQASTSTAGLPQFHNFNS
mmetsp:Transcript_61721/g.147245  ORF Transcript_61721/g.147245 Transcript_61721/m.147245 type:complete len:352 (-) Transcript_61721:94-1149(-)